ncbi:TonB-dependent receptor domain-containing protein [Vreelandella salicampi]|uniref:TonB-dependent receptor n=1 Tax=Vreelandella salicampi TaxID=1449798 RepID=A0A7Z0LNM7_9GAMM|nr:TonB-dependent receptor [Halomonas salicampi]NYS62276.1 TonB-dependent receptor [Halomonas salicampi]
MKTRINTARGLAAFSLAALPMAVQAENASAPKSDAVDFNPVVVTAALAPQTANESLSSVTVIDEATLRRQDPVSIPDLLRGQPGVDVSTNGSFGKVSSVYLRGTGSDSAVLLIDGIRLRSATSGSAAWQHLDPRMFDRAEIVRGPRGSLYGADAVGGVIQLFTPEGEEKGPQPRFSVGGGSFNTQRLSAGISGREGGTRYSFAGSHFNTDGQPIRRDGEDKGYDNTSTLARVAHGFDNGAELGVLALRARGNTEFDSFGTPANTDFVQQVAGIYGELPITDSWSSGLTLSEARDESENFTEASAFGPASTTIFDTQTRTVRWENTITVDAHELIAGAEYQNDSIADSDTGGGTYAEEERDNRAVFAQGLLDFSPLTLQASLRLDDNEAYGDEVTGSLAAGFALDDVHTLRANYGTAFKAPTFNQLYYPGFMNPELEPESSATGELGVRAQYNRWYWDLALYQSDIDNLIINVDTVGDGSVDTPQNVENARIRGAELSSGIELDAWTLQAALTYTDPENRDTGTRLTRRASQSFRLGVDREVGDWSLGGSLVAQNHRYEDTENKERLGGFGLVNLRAGWAFAPMWSARVTVENAFDKEYETSQNYINAGRAGFLSVHFGQ